jgi:transposase
MNQSISQSVSDNGDQPARAEKGNQGILKLGLDMHYRQVTVAMQEESGPIKAVGKMNHDRFEAWIEKKCREGWEIYSCYEAGASGYWLDRELAELGVKNLVVAPKAMGQDKHQKTDRRDSGELVDGLDRYLRGNKKALSPVMVPSTGCVPKESKSGAIGGRRRDGKRSRLTPDSKLGWKSSSGAGAGNFSKPKREQNKLRQRIEALAPQELPKGLGAYSAVALECEMKGIAHFERARAVSSYTGLCPGIHSTNGQGKEGSINRCGNAAVRWNLVETVWRMLKWQPNDEPVRQLGVGLVQSKRAKKRLVVQAARQLAVDLGRLQTGRASAQQLGFVMQKTSRKQTSRPQKAAGKLIAR